MVTMMDKTEILKALSNPLRVEFLEWMRQPEENFSSQAHPLEMGICAQQFERRCGLSQSTVSGHLATLEKAGLVSTTKVGQWTFYHRNEDAIRDFIETLKTSL